MSTKNPTRNRISARDAEDMTKIILDDAIEKLEKERDERVTKLDEAGLVDWPALMNEIAPNIEIKGYENEVHIDLGMGENKRMAYKRLSAETRHNICILVKPGPKQLAKLLKAAKAIEDNKALRESYNMKIRALQSKRNDYKDLAARFRLGFTGNPNDIDDVNSKAKEYLLAREA